MNNVTTFAIAMILITSIAITGCTGTKKVEAPDATQTNEDVGTTGDTVTESVEEPVDLVEEEATAEPLAE
jgi:hypothetical protein